ncbi:hypothetical protein Tco_0190929 [Tanacetum coccineum]
MDICWSSLTDVTSKERMEDLYFRDGIIISTASHVRGGEPMYGYIKNHKKTVKNGKARARESEEYKKKSKNQSRSQKSQASVKSSQDD